MDYYDPMVLFHSFRTTALSTAIAIAACTAYAQSPSVEAPAAPAEEPVVSNPALDAELFYEILLGEVSARTGDPGAGYAFMLEAARRSADGQLYQRAADIALQARSGDYALAAAQAWKEALPQSREANRYVLQILVALNRIGETPDLLRQELAQSPPRSKAAMLSALPQMYGRASDKALAAKVVENALANELTNPATGPIAWVSLGRLRLAAGDKAGALDAARKALELDAGSEGSAQLALQMMDDGTPEAESLVVQALSKQPVPELRMAYARVLLGQQRYADAARQLESATKEKPELVEAWLVLATLHLQDNRLPAAEKDLQRYMELLSASEDPDIRQRGMTQAFLLHAQIAEKKQDYAAAEAWLKRIDNADEVFSAQSRRASLLARQGKIAQARALLRNLPGTSADDMRMKLLAEVQLLRDQRLYQDAYKVQTELVALAPDDVELVYDQAMLAEKAGDFDTMERLLRQVIAQKPQYHHAYNALGYSMAERGQRLSEARELILKALEFAPSDPFITDSLAWVEFRLGNKAEARKLLEVAYKARPDVEIGAHLGEVLWSLGDKDAALKVWKESQRVSPDNETLKDTLARLGVKL
ncbi:lipopolysaccharide assembly protein LapB [Acidovorax sp. sic0104]|uniref:tetratricopeptide repeat protein n=1 Tax=Acidovorax sp. sic0104 TaxID=2854784 RepID=UPI001C45A705|nr:tetratricopeptide repeat protein [Acidovorax sp. sic0104]MBV7539862.1 tetratricopeptide repeat protein [Acidovorax sp. sic0104]